jgi:thymidylate kinase
MDMSPAVSLTRKKADRDKFERDLPLLGRVRESYQRQASAANWARIDAERDKDAVSEAVLTAVRSRLALL